MAKVTFIGAGSLGFTRNLIRDLLTFPKLADATISLMDVDPERLEFARRAAEKIIKQGKYPAKVEATLDRAQALEGADAVLCTILAGGVQVWRSDIEIPKQYGVDFNVGDTRGVAGMFRALRTIPVMLDICRDMERYCPNALMLNYTNPMAMLCHAMQQQSKISVTGLCHSVQGTAGMLAKWIGAPSSEIQYVCAGINHQAWYLKFLWNGKDAYPLIREAMKNPEIYNEEIVRNEMFLHLDYYVTESSGHNSEYNWWFRKRPELIEKYCTHGTGWNPGVHRYILDEYLGREGKWMKDVEEWLKEDNVIDLSRGHEYAAAIINAILGGEPFEFNGNVPNTGLITNIPNDACVEVPVIADHRGLNAMYVGALPIQCAALNNLNVAIENMTVEAAITGNAKLVYQAASYDPVTASVLSLPEIHEMVQAMFEKNADYLPQFSNTAVFA
ncbi:MAG TPA: alpha-galactosidase [Armatimonadota bacterium]|nr:alpha-galactosidase [Armatimonadota bacterium]